jgi:hypothetical protein
VCEHPRVTGGDERRDRRAALQRIAFGRGSAPDAIDAAARALAELDRVERADAAVGAQDAVLDDQTDGIEQLFRANGEPDDTSAEGPGDPSDEDPGAERRRAWPIVVGAAVVAGLLGAAVISGNGVGAGSPASDTGAAASPQPTADAPGSPDAGGASGAGEALRILCFREAGSTRPEVTLEMPAGASTFRTGILDPGASCDSALREDAGDVALMSRMQQLIEEGRECGAVSLADEDGGDTRWFRASGPNSWTSGDDPLAVGWDAGCGERVVLDPLVPPFSIHVVCRQSDTRLAVIGGTEDSGDCPPVFVAGS